MEREKNDFPGIFEVAIEVIQATPNLLFLNKGMQIYNIFINIKSILLLVI